ncbi:MAG: D-alanine--D-alanine ligase [Lentisphaerae bacterium]|nr:D-alanine--D-alanine ligase [Lentisphaerota bacterium]
MAEINKFKKVAVLMGGPSDEREVSLRSGRAVVSGLINAGYEALAIDVTGDDIVIGNDIEAVFIALHGRFGEDGGVQAVLDERGVPYTGSGAEASCAAFDKEISKKIFAENRIMSPKYEILSCHDQRTLPLPVVCKPTCQGSSIGVHRVFKESDWQPAVTDTLKFGRKALVEKYVEGRELTVGIVGGEPLPLVEIVAPNNWYGYEAKYTKGESKYFVPAQVSESISDACKSVAMDVFHALKCRGFGRVDIRLAENGDLYVLEMNSIPGFTETSLLPKAAAEAGMTFPALCDRIMRTAQVG